MSSKLLWHSNAPWTSTGYGQQTALFATRLKEHYDLAISAFYGLEGNALPWNGIPTLPGIGGTYGDETITEHARALFGEDLRSGLVATLMDVWVLDPRIWSRLNTVSWVPVDHTPAPGPICRFLENSGAIPIAMSKFGRDELADFDPLYVPHGIDTKVLRPIDKAEAREKTGMPEDAFIVGMVAANKGNPSRKNFDQAFQAFKALHNKHSDARLYLHTELSGRFEGVNLPRLLRDLGIPEGAVISCDQYRSLHLPFSQETMAETYSSLDVLLSPSAGEGFGIPVIEAQACGVPVIVSDFSAQPELIGAGWKVSGERFYTPIGAWQFRPDIADIAHALEMAYRNSSYPEFAKRARLKAEEYDIDRVFKDFMLPALSEAQERFAERGPLRVAA
jgi:glycosyltransferase involved in cell wall biosynthesis